jgi:hypothetical protein
MSSLPTEGDELLKELRSVGRAHETLCALPPVHNSMLCFPLSDAFVEQPWDCPCVAYGSKSWRPVKQVGTKLAWQCRALCGQQKFLICKEGQLLRWKQHRTGQILLDQPNSQPTYNTKPYTRNYKRLQVVFVYMSGDGYPALCPKHVGKCFASQHMEDNTATPFLHSLAWTLKIFLL